MLCMTCHRVRYAFRTSCFWQGSTTNIDDMDQTILVSAVAVSSDPFYDALAFSFTVWLRPEIPESDRTVRVNGTGVTEVSRCPGRTGALIRLREAAAPFLACSWFG